MRFNRFGAAVGVLATGALLLSACGNNNTTSEGSATSGASSSHNVHCGGKQTLKASGSTAQANAMARFVNAFEQACPGQTLNYTANGSGAGINEFIGNQTDFGGSDVALSDDEHGKAQQRCGSPAWDLPVVFGPIAVTYNVNGVTSLNLDGPTTAKIFNGTIKNWNDPAITALNAGTRCRICRSMWCSAATSPGRRTTSRSTSTAPPTAPGARATGSRSTAASAKAPRATTEPRPPSRTLRGRSPTTNGRSPRRRS